MIGCMDGDLVRVSYRGAERAKVQTVEPCPTASTPSGPARVRRRVPCMLGSVGRGHRRDHSLLKRPRAERTGGSRGALGKHLPLHRVGKSSKPWIRIRREYRR